MTTAAIEIDSWLAWTAIGVVGGIVCSMIYGGRRLLIYDLILGLAAAIVGGWGSVLALGDSSRQTFIMSVLTSLLLAAAVLWIFNTLATPRKHRQNDRPS